ncbi:MAG: DUF805 domain-containing protein [Candidatus Krumholzibacteria bacterium]|nr:DUF805 domain-containing protein [Candidatus Krumholzibacteria bacterium]
MQWYMQAWRDYKKFDGRSRRTEYWMFLLVNIGVSIALGVVEAMFGSPGILSWLYSLAVLVPAIAVSIRRLHDIGLPGLWVLVILIPFLNLLLALIFLTRDSQPGSNEYGPNPKGA